MILSLLSGGVEWTDFFLAEDDWGRFVGQGRDGGGRTIDQYRYTYINIAKPVE